MHYYSTPMGGGGNKEERDQVLEYCKDNNIKTVHTATLLGYDLHQSGIGDNQLENWESIKVKMKNQIRIWGALNLSLTGKIMVAKTFVYSQLIFYGSIFLPPDETINELEKIIEEFVNEPKRIRKDFLTTSVGEGGLGLFDIGILLRAIQVNFIRKNIINGDAWAHLIRQNNKMIELGWIHDTMMNRNEFPVLWNMINSINLAKNKFNNVDGNIFCANILYNDMVKNSQGNIITQIFENEAHEYMMNNVDKMIFKNMVIKNDQGNLQPIQKTTLEGLITHTLTLEEYKTFRIYGKINVYWKIGKY